MIRAITTEARLAQDFLRTLPGPRVPWAERFDAWAAERGLSCDLTSAVRITVIRLRNFAGVPQPRRAR